MDFDYPKRSRDLPQTEALFRLDVKGDRQNLAYEGLHRASIPKYYTAGRGNVIGLDKGSRLVHTLDSRRKLIAHGIDSAVKQRSSALPLPTAQSSQLVRGSQLSESDLNDQQDYVHVSDGIARKRRRLAADGDSSSSEDEVVEETQPLPPNVDASTAIQDEIHRRQRQLLDKTSKNPNDIEAWLALGELQPDIVRSSGRRLTASESRTVSELKITLYREAVAKATDSAARHSLIVGLLKEGSKLWDRSKQLSEWRTSVNEQPSFELSLLYLNFVQSNSSESPYEHCIQEYQKCLTSQIERPKGLDRDRDVLYLILRLTAFMQQYGFMELAIAIWQSLFEFNLLCPASVPSAAADSSFEEFWDSEASRVGEANAKGWKNSNLQPPEPTEDSDMPIDAKHLWQSWCSAEKSAESLGCVPARTMDNTSADDPFRVVLYSDIEKYLFELSGPESAVVLMDAFLYYLGLPSIEGSAASYAWRNDPFLYPMSNPHSPSTSGNSLRNATFTGVSDFNTLFATIDPFRAFQRDAQASSKTKFALSAVEQIAVSQSDNDAFGVYAIVLVSQNDAKAARKLSKRLIRQKSGSVKLYNAYALVESRMGNQDVAENVWRTTLTMHASSTETDRLSILQLWQSWIFETLLNEGYLKALNLLSSFSLSAFDGELLYRTDAKVAEALLEAERSLQILVNQQLSSQPTEELILATELLAILRYCQGAKDLGAAIETYGTVLKLLAGMVLGCHMLLEALHQREAHLIHAHTSLGYGAFEPKSVLSTLSRSVSAFPNNSTFLQLHDQYQRRYGVMDRLRGVAQSALSDTPDTFMSLVHKIARELSGSENTGTTEHSIRSAFARAIDDNVPAQHCPSVRLAHVHWELSTLESHLQKQPDTTKPKRKQLSIAVEAFHSALRACPWVKELYMLAFGSAILRDALGPAGLKGLYEMILERGLRVRFDISEMLEGKELEKGEGQANLKFRYLV